MGSPPDEPERRSDEVQLEVTLTKGFWTGRYEVTQGQWKRVVGNLPGDLTAAGGEGGEQEVLDTLFFACVGIGAADNGSHRAGRVARPARPA